MSKASDNDYDLILIDGSSYLYRAFHALPALTNSQGRPTGAIYGVINMIKKLFAEHGAKHVAVVFDSKGKTVRHKLYPQYKAHRPPMPPELITQIEPLHELIKDMGIPLVIMDGIEADDIIATLAHRARQKGMKTLISTGDKDLAQLVNEQIQLINTMTEVFLDSDGVKNKFGVKPEQMIDYLTLVGDSSDNIPGVPKVGPKTAVKWLEQFDTLTEIIKNADNIPGKIGENLRTHLKQLPLSKQLVTLKTDITLGFGPEKLTKSPPNDVKLIATVKQLEFKKWLAELLKQIPRQQANYHPILTEQKFAEWLKKITAAKLFSVDLETTSLRPLDAEIVGVSLATTTDTAVYIPVAHDYNDAPPQLERDFVLKKLKPILEDKNKIKVGQNLKYDYKVLKNYDIELKGIAFDTMLESYVLDSTSNRHDMDSLALKYLGTNTIKFKDVAGSGKTQLTFNQITIDKATEYAAEDADITLKLHNKLYPELGKHAGLLKLFAEIEMPLVPILAEMEYYGVNIDKNILRKQGEGLAVRITSLQKKAHELAEQEFNLNSPKQLREILYQKLNLPILKKTPKGQPSTAEPVLQELAFGYPLPKVILEFRSLFKLKTTYVDALPEQINPKTGRIHTSYNQAVTSTGRLSSTNPNLQNIPTRTEEGRNIRKAFVAPAEKKIVAADYSQIELRIMAHLSQDGGLLNAFNNNQDIHRSTAAEIFGIQPEKVTPTQRRQAKAINFGLIYGMSAFGLAQQLNIGHKQAQQYIDIYFERYPEVKEYMEQTRLMAHKQGYVETIFGRRLQVPDIKSSNLHRRNAAERAAINAPMQGTAADIIKIAMINIAKWLDQNSEIRMIMQVHDELVFEIPENMVASAAKQIEKFMTAAANLDVPLLVNIGVGDNWDEAH